MKFDEPPADVEWNEWGPAVRVEIEQSPVMLFARAVKDSDPLYASARTAAASGFERVPVPPTYTFVMAASGAFPDIQPPGGTGSMYASASAGADAASAFARDGLFLHGEQHFTYHRQVFVGDVLEGRMRTSKPISRQARRGPMEVTYFQTSWTDLSGAPVVDERIVSLFFPNT